MISLLFVTVNSALLGRTLFYSYKLFLDEIQFNYQSGIEYKNFLGGMFFAESFYKIQT